MAEAPKREKTVSSEVVSPSVSSLGVFDDPAYAKLALEKAPALGFDKFIVTATTPFDRGDLAELGRDAPAVVARRYPQYAAIYATRGWQMLPTLDRVYVNAHARERLGWQPRYDFERALRNLAAGEDYRSELARAIGSKGYHPA